MAGLGRTRSPPQLAAKRSAMPGIELRAGRAPCVLSRRRHAGLGGTGRDRRRPRRWLFGFLRLRHGGDRGDFLNSPPARSWPCRTTATRVSRDSPKLAKAAAGGPSIASSLPTPQAGSRCAACGSELAIDADGGGARRFRKRCAPTFL